jgi:tRNA dimethylallyltransferase
MFISNGQQKRKMIILAGPTAVGKTAVGIYLAKKIGGEIVSCDSMQVYQEVSIANNKPASEELTMVPHHLIGIVPVSQNFDVAVFRSMAQECIEKIFLKNSIPIIVGGTGMYLRALLDGIFKGERVPEAVRQALEEELASGGQDRLYQELQEKDPVAAAKIHYNDTRRIIRALEVCRFTGSPISNLQKEADGLWGKYDIAFFGLNMDRKRLYDQIDRRVDQMFDQGLIDEIQMLQGKKISRTAGAIIGIKEVSAYLSGRFSLHEAKEEMKKNTRRLAKRQLTWFRMEKRLRWIDIAENESIEQAAENILHILNGDQE